jgi:D-tyrosyl-tRNA(Tyr) deacylase
LALLWGFSPNCQNLLTVGSDMQALYHILADWSNNILGKLLFAIKYLLRYNIVNLEFGGAGMKAVLQRVSEAEVAVDDEVVGSINRGYLIFLGVTSSDTKTQVETLVEKIAKLRIFPDENGKSNLSITDIDGEILVVSQFTLYADTRKGNRPSFIEAAPPELANELYEYFIAYSKDKFKNVPTGSFGASMQVQLVNDGPYTIILETS